MAIASGLTCVDYLATQYNPQNFSAEDLRYSPTFDVGNILSTIITRQQQSSTDSSSYGNRYTFSSNVPPVLEFTTLSLVENDLEFTLESNSKNTNDYDSNRNDNSTERSDFVVVCEQMKDLLNSQKQKYSSDLKPCRQDDVFNDERINNNIAVSKCKQNSMVSCQRNIIRSNSYDVGTAYESDEDEELGAIFSDEKPCNRKGEQRFVNSRCRSKPCFYKFRPRLYADLDECDELSDSEFELSKIIPNGFSSEIQHFSRNTRKRSSAEILHTAGACFKRPCIDAEKMHNSIRRKEVFVPISKF